jgi:hypothetical protein
MFQAKKAKQADIDRKRAEVRKRLEETAKAKKAKKGFMTPERKKKLRVSREHVVPNLSGFRVSNGQGREPHDTVFIQHCKMDVFEESRPRSKKNSCQNSGGPSALKIFPLLTIILPLPISMYRRLLRCSIVLTRLHSIISMVHLFPSSSVIQHWVAV